MLAYTGKQMSDAPKAVEDLGLDGRYRYWTGRSGNRYLFTEVPLDQLEDFASSVAMLMRSSGSMAEPERMENMIWLGEVDADHKRRGRTLVAVMRGKTEGVRAFVHLLAGDASHRKAVLDDLSSLSEAS